MSRDRHLSLNRDHVNELHGRAALQSLCDHCFMFSYRSASTLCVPDASSDTGVLFNLNSWTTAKTLLLTSPFYFCSDYLVISWRVAIVRSSRLLHDLTPLSRTQPLLHCNLVWAHVLKENRSRRAKRHYFHFVAFNRNTYMSQISNGESLALIHLTYIFVIQIFFFFIILTRRLL